MVTLPDGERILVYEVPITESQANQPVYCSGAAIAQNHGDTLHVVFYIEQPTVAGGSERTANLRVTMSIGGWEQAVDVITRAIKGETADG